EKMWDNYRDLLTIVRADAKLSPKGPNPVRVLVMPETAITYHHLDTPQAVEAMRGALMHFREPTYVLTGALLKDTHGYHNSLVALDQDVHQIFSFDKFHLVPFGEYIPFQKYIPIGPITNFSGFVEGPGPRTVMLDDIPPFSPLVCYEVIFPGEVTSDNPQRPEWIVNVTNDAWYGVSAGPYQHLAHAIYRAIEEGVPVVRSANTGVSAVVDPYGRLVTVTPLLSPYSAESLLPLPAEAQPLYSRLKTY
ncbi:MAG TPA: apolipoprotein N-acyltransferase, partial [Alphaproteobacteria bacterium]|nr:apolipoprotein N-acyltransferase [Alphaproteobacteria bacterium]